LRLDRLLGAVPVLDVRGDPSAIDVLDVTHDSASVRPGSLFCCLPGSRRDGHDFATAAVEAGAVALLVERFVDEAAAPQVVVADARSAMAPLAAELHGNPSRTLSVVGVTGTNGKTTTTYLVRSILEAAGRPTGVLGTMSGSRTTPEAPVLQATLAEFVRDGMVAAAIEVSSVGLVQRRVDATWFAAAVFTGLSQDHLDEHGTMEDYFEAKALLFTPERAAVGVVNADDEHGQVLLARENGLAMRPYSMADAGDLELRVGSSGFTWDGERVDLPLDGAFNVSNALAAATACRELGVSAADVARGLSSVGVIAGHSEAIAAGQEFRVVVDYAHTPLALESVLKAARQAAGESGKVLTVFGCGGDRDPTKRGPMGWAASCEADVVVVTSDNPRHEDPDAIIASVVEGATGGALVLVEPDRRAAIALAFARASAGDVVVLAGKGHETGQTIGDQVLPFDDKAVALELLSSRSGS
jgi:UDP-N-acetylmuramoyl-L-alanyl-D-glutamate--2,6-diaminopimelate ligase